MQTGRGLVLYTVRVSPQTHHKLRRVAAINGCETPAAYLRFLADQVESDPPPKPAIEGSVKAGALPTEASPDLLSTLNREFARLESRIDTQFRRMQAYLEAAIGQGAHAAYLSAMVWRLCADQNSLPPGGGLPPAIRRDIHDMIQTLLHNASTGT
jgi:hypothetical protein